MPASSDGPLRRRLQPSQPDENSPSLPSSFLAIPAAALTGVGIFAPAARLLLRAQTYVAGTHALHRRLRRLLEGTGIGGSDSTAAAAAAHAIVAAVALPAADDVLLPAIWCLLRDAVFLVDKGRARRVLLVVCAVVANHARRVFFVLDATGGVAAAGWLGAAAIAPRTPDAAWSLVRARPDVFLVDATTVTAGHTGPGAATITAVLARTLAALIGASLRKRAWDVAAGGGAALVLGRAGRRRPGGAHDLAAVVFLVWLCSCVEYAVDRAFHAGLWAAACMAVVREVWATGATGGRQDGVAVADRSATLAAAGATVPLLAMATVGSAHMAGYGIGAVVPLVRAGVRQAGDRQPGLLIVLLAAVGAVHAMVRFRSWVYLATEASGLFVCGGYAALGAALVLVAA